MSDPDGGAVRADLPFVRQQRIRAMVENNPFVRTNDLAESLGVTSVTIRADLVELEAAGHLRRVRGGAVGMGLTESSYESMVGEGESAKAAIAAAAVDLIQNGQTVLIDAGTTAAALARLLPASDLTGVTVVTNNLVAAYELRYAENVNLILTGGTFRANQHSLVEPLGTLLLERIRADFAFIGCTGISPADGVTNVNLPEAQLKIAMMRSARRTVVLAHEAKVGHGDSAVVCALSEVDVLVTDADPTRCEAIEQTGVRVVRVDAVA